MENYFRKFLLLLVIPILLGNCSQIFAQMSRDLRDFLWEKEFDTLIADYAEDKIILRDQGDFKERMLRRSFTETSGYRVQTFAGSDRENAEKMATRLINLNLDSVYVIEEKGLYKVQIGNFTEKLEAEKMLDLLRFQDMSNTWIVETLIHVPKQPVAPPVTTTFDTESSSPNFAIQLFVTKDKRKAEEFSEKFSEELGDSSRVFQTAEFWKVLSGRYIQESKARERLEEIRNSGYPDAWITQINQ
jgi:hypothetical protein